MKRLFLVVNISVFTLIFNIGNLYHHICIYIYVISVNTIYYVGASLPFGASDFETSVHPKAVLDTEDLASDRRDFGALLR